MKYISDAKTPAIFNRIIEVLKEHLTKDEWVAFCEELDGCADIYECVAEYVATIAPELCQDPSDVKENDED